MTEVSWLNDGDVVEAKRGRFVAEKGSSYWTSTILPKKKSLVRIRNICISEAAPQCPKHDNLEQKWKPAHSEARK